MKKRISILLVVAMLVSSLLTFTVATAETTTPELLVYGGASVDKDALGISKFTAGKVGTDFGSITFDTDEYLVLNVVAKNVVNVSTIGVCLKYDTNILAPVYAYYDEEEDGYLIADATADAVIFSNMATNGVTPTGKFAFQAAGTKADTAKGLVSLFGNATTADGYKAPNTTDWLRIGCVAFKYVNEKTADDLTVNSVTLANDAEAKAHYGNDMSGIYLNDGEKDYRASADTAYDVSLAFAYGAKAASTEPPATEEPATEEPATEEPATEEPTEEPSSDNRLSWKKLFISGMKEVDASESEADFKLAAIDGFAKYVVAAYKADAGATVDSAIVADLDEATIAAANWTGSWSIGVTADKLPTDATVYVVFKVTAANGDVAYYTVEIVNPKNRVSAMKSLFISGFELDGNLASDKTEYNIRKINGFKKYVLAARVKDSKSTVEYRVATNGQTYDEAPVRLGAASTGAIGIDANAFTYGDVIYITVTAEDGVTSTIYTFNVVNTIE